MLNDVNAKDRDINLFLEFLSKKAGVEIQTLATIPESLFAVVVGSLKMKKEQMRKGESNGDN